MKTRKKVAIMPNWLITRYIHTDTQTKNKAFKEEKKKLPKKKLETTFLLCKLKLLSEYYYYYEQSEPHRSGLID